MGTLTAGGVSGPRGSTAAPYSENRNGSAAVLYNENRSGAPPHRTMATLTAAGAAANGLWHRALDSRAGSRNSKEDNDHG